MTRGACKSYRAPARANKVADPRRADRVERAPAQNSAIGLTGEPVVCCSRRGAIVSRNSQRRRAAQAAANSSRLPLSISQRSEEHTSELQSPCNLVCRLLL